jgi:hypothetical protein
VQEAAIKTRKIDKKIRMLRCIYFKIIKIPVLKPKKLIPKRENNAKCTYKSGELFRRITPRFINKNSFRN